MGIAPVNLGRICMILKHAPLLFIGYTLLNPCMAKAEDVSNPHYNHVIKQFVHLECYIYSIKSEIPLLKTYGLKHRTSWIINYVTFYDPLIDGDRLEHSIIEAASTAALFMPEYTKEVARSLFYRKECDKIKEKPAYIINSPANHL
jgi:hypothetical protein